MQTSKLIRYGALALVALPCLAGLSYQALVWKKARDLHVAHPKYHDYAKPELGREGHLHAEHPVNQYRIYDFYQRQADHYLQALIPQQTYPAFPGLDAGLHGHWGKNHQMANKDGQRQTMQHDSVVKNRVEVPKGILSANAIVYESGITTELDQGQQLHALFDPKSCLYIATFKGGFLRFSDISWGVTTPAQVEGELHHQLSVPSSPQKDAIFLGYYPLLNQTIFKYQLQNSLLLDSLSYKNNQLLRQIEHLSAPTSFSLILAQGNQLQKVDSNTYSYQQLGHTQKLTLSSETQNHTVTEKNGQLYLNVQEARQHQHILIHYHDENKTSEEIPRPPSPKLSQTIKAPPATLQQYNYTTQGQNQTTASAYALDTIEVPFKNTQNSMMFFTGIAFSPEGDAYLSTLMGEIWKVSGLDQKLEQVIWQKVATGLNNPFGLQYHNQGLVVLERTALTRLHDHNQDGQFDYYETLHQNFSDHSKGHSYNYGLEIDKHGQLYFSSGSHILQFTADGSSFKSIFDGLRYPMAFGQANGKILAGPQEGEYTPASSVFEISPDHYQDIKKNRANALPLCYIPRGVDGSTGGFIQNTDARFGPLKDTLLGFSYGYGQWFQILRDSYEGGHQGAIVPMPGEFLSGAVRAAINPKDGQVYVVGLNGWGDYSIHDGSLQRLRYTQQPMLQPIGFKVYANGIQVDFDTVLSTDLQKENKFFAQMWDYVNSGQYGSPEYRVGQKERGHTGLTVTQTHLFNNNQSIFIEIPQIQPVMQMHLRMHLHTAEGKGFKTDLFPTIHKLGPVFNFDGIHPPLPKNFKKLKVRTQIKLPTQSLSISGRENPRARVIEIHVHGDMKFAEETFSVQAGEELALVLINNDAMPHNLVITEPQAKEKVGEASFKMMIDPMAQAKHYVPSLDEVVAYTHVVEPNRSHKTYFKAPETPGEYPYICTFPGHWQLMQGKMIVTPRQK